MYTPLRIDKTQVLFTPIVTIVLCVLLAACNVNISIPNLPASTGNTSSTGNGQCQSNCTMGSGVHGVQVFVEPNAGESAITDAINAAQKSVWVEIYLLSDRRVIRALEDAANRGIDVRVMLEPHPFGSGGSPARTIDELNAAGIKAQATSPDFTLTHEKGIPILRNASVQL